MENKDAAKSVWNHALIQLLIYPLFAAMIIFLLEQYLPKIIDTQNGIIATQNPIETNSNCIYTVHIENFQKKEVNGLKFAVSSDDSVLNISSNGGIKIELSDKNESNNSIVYTINELYGNTSNEFVIIFNKPNADINDIEFLNNREYGFLLSSSSIFNYKKMEQRNGIRLVAVIFIFMVISGFINYYQNQKDRMEFLKLKDKFESTLEEAKMESKRAKTYFGKYKIYSLNRAMDYQKERDFWRMIVKRLLLNSSSNIEPKEIFEHVTKELNTFSTNYNEVAEFERLMLLNKMAEHSEDN